VTEAIRFFLPGPTYVSAGVRQAMTRPMMGHRSAEFRQLWNSLGRRLPGVLRTAGDGMIATGSSTLLLESAILSLVERDVLHLVCGAFSRRWADISRSHGRAVDTIEVEWGQAVAPELVRAALRRKRYEAVAVVHSETSTGVLNPLSEIARAVREESDALVLVDAVSSLAGAPVETDAWGLDLVLAGTQKALALPPGLVVFALSERAAERAGRLPHRGFYTDLLETRRRHREGGAVTTPAIPLIYALDAQLDRVLAEGMEPRWSRHAALARRTRDWALGQGIAFASAEGARSPTVSCLRAPARIAAPTLVAEAKRRGFTIGGGYGDWKASTFRIGHMGEVSVADLQALLEGLDEILAACAA
jgi:aspartate aminotransferase-like enzyme